MTTFIIPTPDTHPVLADLYSSERRGAGSRRVVVLCHGFKGHRRWGFIPRLAQRLFEGGVAVLSIDFSHNGRIPSDAAKLDLGSSDVSTGPEAGGSFARDDPPIVAPELFRRNTIERECADLRRALDWARDSFGATAVGVWGHSRGGVAAALVAIDDPSVDALVTWAAAANPDFYTDRQKRSWRENGAYEFRDADTGEPLSIGVEYLDDLERHAARYALSDRAGEIRQPHLIVHGEHDLVIPVEDAERLYDASVAGGAGADKELLRLPTGHTFGYGARDGLAALDQATTATVAWFSHRL